MAPKNPRSDKGRAQRTPDPLSREELAKDYGYALKVLYSDTELAKLFETAVSEGWNNNRFQAELRNTNWFQTNNEFARTAWVAERMGGADWEASLQDARARVRQEAVAVGADLTDQEAESLARQYIYGGWRDPARTQFLAEALSKEIQVFPEGRTFRGSSGNLVDDLKALATSNGLQYTDDWYLGAAKSVASNLSTADDWIGDIREQAASLYPIYSDRIRSGMSASDLASPYINMMANEFEMNPADITLTDPYVKQALMGIDDKGNPKPMSLWEFQKKLRNDPRWLNTTKAGNEVATVVNDVLQAFGMRG